MIETLLKFGLSYKEAKLYVALLEIGSSVVSDIAKKTDMNRSTTYVLLESLVQRGLISISEKNSIKVYTPSPPDRLVQYLQEHVKKYTELIGVAQSLLPELRSMYTGTGPKPRVQYYEGGEGIKTAYEDTLTSTEPIRAFASINNMHEALPDYFPDYYLRRASKGINIRAIFPDTPEARERIKSNAQENRESMLVPTDRYAFSPEINIYDNKVSFFSWIERFALVVESRELADALKKAFDLSWLGAQHVKTESKKKT
jgi:sugar-specific transcriptional regulator TrmB